MNLLKKVSMFMLVFFTTQANALKTWKTQEEVIVWANIKAKKKGLKNDFNTLVVYSKRNAPVGSMLGDFYMKETRGRKIIENKYRAYTNNNKAKELVIVDVRG